MKNKNYNSLKKIILDKNNKSVINEFFILSTRLYYLIYYKLMSENLENILYNPICVWVVLHVVLD